MLESEVLISELVCPPYSGGACAIAIEEVAALKHKILNLKTPLVFCMSHFEPLHIKVFDLQR